MIDQKITAFQLPKMRITEKWDFQMQGVLKELDCAQLFFATFQDQKGDLKVLHTPFDEEMYALMQTTLHRNIEVYDFMKLCLINAEKFRNGEMNEAYEIMTRAIEYINVRKSKNLNL